MVTPQLEIEKQTRKMEGLEEVNRRLRERMETLKERLEVVTLEKTTALENILKRVETLEKKLAEKS